MREIHTHPQWPSLGSAGSWGQELDPELPRGWQGPSSSSHHQWVPGPVVAGSCILEM